jgi:hypothetical protein
MIPMNEVHINIVIHFNAQTIAAEKVMLESLLEHEQTESTRQAIDRLRKEIATQEAMLNNRKPAIAQT